MWFSNDGDGSHDPNTDASELLWPGGINAIQEVIFEDGLIYGGIIEGNYYAGGNTFTQGMQPAI